MKILCLGKSKQGFINDGIAEYNKRLTSYTKLKIVELPDVKLSNTNTIEQVKEKEAERIIKLISKTDFVITLDEKGKELTSKKFADFLEQRFNQSKNIVFIIGGVYGLAPAVLKRSDLTLSFSRFTFTHQMIRFILLEQIYRAFTIMKGKKYHY